jgi:hypothetical protein
MTLFKALSKERPTERAIAALISAAPLIIKGLARKAAQRIDPVD